MRKIDLLVISLLSMGALIVGCASAPGPESSILVTEQEQVIGLTVPVSKVAIDFPKGRYQRVLIPNAGGGLANPRYFQFYDEARGVRLSGWFEPASKFRGVKDNPPATFDGMPLEHRNVVFKKIGSWDVIEYDVFARNLGIANLTGHLVRAGTWVELHLSGDPKQSLAEQHAILADTIQSIQIREKP